MELSKRQFLITSGAALAALPLRHSAMASPLATARSVENSTLKSLTENVTPISVKERQDRIAKAQQLMQQHNIAAMILEPGAAMDYFSGIQWWRSERLTAVVIPKEGEIAVICPFFEEPSIRETLAVGEDVRVWQEHEIPVERVNQILNDRKINRGTLAL